MVNENPNTIDKPHYEEKSVARFFDKNKILFILIGIAIAIAIIRYVSIFFMPDVFSDEDIILKHMIAIRTTGADYYEKKTLFSTVGAGYTTYVYLYPMIFFSYFLGDVSAEKARIIQQTLTIGASILLAFGVKNWFNNKKLFWITLYTALTLPWGFVQANRIWDPAFVWVYFSIFFFFFSFLMKNEKIDIKYNGDNKKFRIYSNLRGYIYSISMAISLVLLATVYPPARIPAVFMWITVVIWLLVKIRINWIMLIALIVASILVALPLAYNIFFNKEFNSRTSSLLVFQENRSLASSLLLWVKNTINLFNPSFLFFTGDWIYRHSLPVFGLLGTINLFPIIFLFYKRKESSNSLNWFLLGIIILTCISTGLTNDYSPHSLRSCLCFFPYAILIAQGWYLILRSRPRYAKNIWYGVIITSFIIYVIFFILIGKGILRFEDAGFATYNFG